MLAILKKYRAKTDQLSKLRTPSTTSILWAKPGKVRLSRGQECPRHTSSGSP